jgi:hypothetical protein
LGTDPAPSPIGSSHGAIFKPFFAWKWKDSHPNLFWVQTLTPNLNPLGPDSEPILNPFRSRHRRTQTQTHLGLNRKGSTPKPILGPDTEGPKPNPLGSDSEPHPNPSRSRHGRTQTQKPLGMNPHPNPNPNHIGKDPNPFGSVYAPIPQPLRSGHRPYPKPIMVWTGKDLNLNLLSSRSKR